MKSPEPGIILLSADCEHADVELSTTVLLLIVVTTLTLQYACMLNIQGKANLCCHSRPREA